MNQYLKQAYLWGSQQATQDFQKTSSQAWGEGSRLGDILAPALSSLPVVGPPLAGYASGKTTPLSPGPVGAMTTAGGSFGQAAGGLGGAALGTALGGLGGHLAEKYDLIEGATPGRGAALGALLGGTLGTMGGGAYGAHKGRHATEEAAKQEISEDALESVQRQQNRAQENQAALEAIQRSRQMGQQELLQQLIQRGYLRQPQQPAARPETPRYPEM